MMKSIKCTILILFLGFNFQVLIAQNFKFNYGTAPYETIVGSGQKWYLPHFGRHAFPADFFIEGFGNVDSVRFSTSSMTLFSNSSNGPAYISCNSRGEEGELPDLIDIWSKTVEKNGEAVFIIEYRVRYESFPNEIGNYQVQYYLESGNIRYHYNTPGFNDVIDDVTIGFLIDEALYAMYLKGDPAAPKVATAAAEVGYLENLPAPETYYEFANQSTSIGDKEILAKAIVQQTENGFRVNGQGLELDAELLNLEGKKIAIGESYNSAFVFLKPETQLKSGIYLLHLTNRQNGKSASMKVYRE